MRMRHARRMSLSLAFAAALSAAGCDDLVTAPDHVLQPRHDVIALNGGITTFTSRAAWAAAVAAASGTVVDMSFTGLTLGRVTQLDTDYGAFRIVVDDVAASTFSNPGIAIFPDASCSLGTGDCDVFTFNLRDPTSTLDMPSVNRLVFPQPISAFGGDFVQLGFAPVPAPGTATGAVTLQFGTETVVINSSLDANGNGFFGFIAGTPGTTISFTFARSGTLQNDIFDVYNPAYAAGTQSTPEAALTELRNVLQALDLPRGMTSSVDAKLRAALTALAANDTATACGALRSLINHVRAQSGKHIPEGDAALLIAEAMSIRSALGC